MDSPDPNTRSSLIIPDVLPVVKDTNSVIASVPTGKPQANEPLTDELLVEPAKQVHLTPSNNLSLSLTILILPFEIVAEIFTFYTVEINGYGLNSKSGRSGPLQLAEVCKTWREIALTTPYLWTTMNILVPSLAKISLFSELVGYWLSRSGQLTLNISISMSVSILRELMRVPSDQNQILPLFNVIRGSSPRWRQLTLRIPAELYEDFLGAVTTAPLLEYLRITPFGVLNQERKGKFHLASVPRLRVLEVSSIYIDQIRIPWHNLTLIQAHAIFIDEMLEVLKCADQLLFAEFSDICVFPFPATPLTHRSLRHLDLRPEASNDLGTNINLFLDNITLPSLESLVYHPQDVFPVDHLLSLFARSRCVINNFEIVIPEDAAADVTEEDLIRLLQGVPTVTRLSVSLLELQHREIVTDYFLACLAEGVSLLPHLEVLNFVGWRGFSWQAIADILTFKNCCVKLRLVDISVNRSKDENADTIPLIDKPTVSRLLCPRNPHMIVKIWDDTTGMDMIAGSLAFHGLSPDT